jgi:FdhD protein
VSTSPERGQNERREQRELDVHRIDATGRRASARDRVVVEEPLEIRVGGESLLVTMRTPGADFDLVRGLLFTEGLVERADDVVGVAHCDDVPVDARGNVVLVALRPGLSLDAARTARATWMSSACGVCGKATLESLRLQCAPVAQGPTVAFATLAALPERMRAAQPVFDATGGLHAAALFDAHGKLLALAEDIGRHNAVDKVIGVAARLRALPLSEAILVVSGRAGFEIITKARRAGIPIVASVSAASSLAIDVAKDAGMTLLGFVRDGTATVYCGDARVG